MKQLETSRKVMCTNIEQESPRTVGEDTLKWSPCRKCSEIGLYGSKVKNGGKTICIWPAVECTWHTDSVAEDTGVSAQHIHAHFQTTLHVSRLCPFIKVEMWAGSGHEDVDPPEEHWVFSARAPVFHTSPSTGHELVIFYCIISRRPAVSNCWQVIGCLRGRKIPSLVSRPMASRCRQIRFGAIPPFYESFYI